MAKATMTAAERLEFELERQLEQEAAEVRYVWGITEVELGLRPLVPTTVYNVSGDDSSGIAGLIHPNGEFVRTAKALTSQRYWNFDETYLYKKLDDGRVVGYSWARVEVLWDGSVAGDIDVNALDGDESDAVFLGGTGRNRINRRTIDRSITGDWLSTGELWRALVRGTEMQGGPVAGKIHRSN